MNTLVFQYNIRHVLATRVEEHKHLLYWDWVDSGKRNDTLRPYYPPCFKTEQMMLYWTEGIQKWMNCMNVHPNVVATIGLTDTIELTFDRESSALLFKLTWL